MVRGGIVLAVIPARGGSKRCPRKNLREYQGVPLVLRAWASALQSRYVDLVVISSEDAEVKALADKHSATCIDRPPHLATDDATNEDVLRHAMQSFRCDWIVLLQPTSPLRTAEDIDQCIERAVSNGLAALTVNERGHKNGAVYVASAEWIAKHDFSHAGYAKLVMPDERSLDIDFPDDFNR